MVTIEELQKSIVEEKKKVKKAQEQQALEIKRSELSKELFKLKHRKKIASVGKGARLLREAGKGIIKVGKRAAPIIKKQSRLIREQQLRDEAIERRLKKKKPTKKRKISKSKPQKLNLFNELEF